MDNGHFGAELAVHMAALERSIDSTARALDRSTRTYDAIARSAEKAQAAIESLSSARADSGNAGAATPAPRGGVDAGRVGGEMVSALMPLESIGSHITAQLDRVGGTIVTLARRIDGAIKWDFFESQLDRLAEKNKSTFVKIAVDWANTARKWYSFIADFGDVAKRGLDKVAGLGTAFRAIHGPIATATTSVRRLGLELGVALGVAGLAYKAGEGIRSFIGTGIKGASDLNEAYSKVGAVFGQAGKAITSEADAMAKSFGIVKKDYIEGAVGIAQMGRAAGKTDAQAVALGNTFAKLAQDFSSQDNLPFTEALDKLRSGLAGESEPLRRYGVLLDEAAVKAYALANGIGKGHKELTAGEKVTARAGLITQALARVNGDLAATVDQPARAYARFAGTLENMATAVGTMFLPVVKKGLGLLNEFATFLGTSFEANQGAVKGFVDRVVYGLGTIEVIFKNWPKVMDMFWLKTHEVFTNFDAIVATIMPNFQVISNYVANNWYKVLWDVFNGLNKAVNGLLLNLGKLGKAWLEFARGDMQAFSKVQWTPLLDGFKATADQLPDLIKPALISLDKEIAGIWDGINRRQSSFLSGIMGGVNEAVRGVNSAMKEATPAAKAEAPTAEKRQNAAASFGSSEAASAIAKHRNQADDAVLKEARRQSGLQERIAAAVEKFNQSQAGPGGTVLPFAI
jgi:hypothetical protein